MGAWYEEDVRALATDERIPWRALEDSCVVVTGSTGLIGGLLSRALLLRNRIAGGTMRVVLPVRNIERAQSIYGDDAAAHLLRWDATQWQEFEALECDYVLHCASNTDSRLMIEKPVDTILTTVEGTRCMLDLTRANEARMCFVSSMEVYGSGSSEKLGEQRGGELDAMSPRSSYPQSKQLAETLCAAYHAQFGTQVCVARLAQSFGAGIAPADRRIFALIARCCMHGEDIELLTDGSKSNMYVCTVDAVRALLTLVVQGTGGEAYNVANEETFCSVFEMAQMAARLFGNGVSVRRKLDADGARRFAVGGTIRMDTTRIQQLGWRPDYDLAQMYERMIDDWKTEGQELQK